MKIAIAQINPIIGDFNYNFNKMINFIEKAKTDSCDLIVFSEMVITGYPPRDLLEKKNFIDANLNCLNRLIETVKDIGVICGYVDRNLTCEGNPFHNSLAFFENGVLLNKVYKQLLPSYDVFDERRFFEPGVASKVFPYKGKRLGLTICEDLWNDGTIIKKRLYATDPLALLKDQGVDLIINISASPFNAGKKELRCKLLNSLSQRYRVPFIYANQVGGNDSILFDGTSCAFDKNGKMIACASDFKEDMIMFDLNGSNKDIHSVAESEVESILNALIMGTRDYVTKCGFSKAVIGLSGGIDSALVAYIAVEALGKENVLTLFMPSRYTSKENYEDTQKLSDNLGIRLEHVPIDDMFKDFLRFLSPDFDEDAPSVTEQNIQARIRGTILMGVSNRDGYMLLSTGNKSEMAVGYCTLYGDMNGGLAVISDVPKTVVYKLANFINRGKEIIPVRIIEKAPSAELKKNQKDQDDLPEYEILDQILKAYIEEFKGADEIVAMGFDKKLVQEIIKKVDRNEYKRQQAPPGLRVTSKAFGYGRRYPIAQKY